ncbi:MAG: FtsQ-type POTRA domain-containing protein [Deltaproteobacteria bacterium]|nr:FtsQ-type POTRA domain-containing protein [Deltaproteobacteria bacterium]MBI3386869.1 FtsQ-type POTRA domain-containing protein [Deltaproteobacteria bacterium]
MKRRRRKMFGKRSRVPWRRLALPCVLVSAALALMASVCWMVPRVWTAASHHHYFTLTEVSVRGNSHLSREDLLRWGDLRPGMSIWDADPSQVRARLREHPDLRDAQVRRDFPSRLVIVVRERTPVAIAVLDDLYFVDRSGRVMNRLDDSDSRDLPLITGLRASAVDNSDAVLLRRAVRLVRLCRREGCGAGLSEVNVDARRGVTIVPLRRSVPIVLGWGNWRGKLTRTSRVLAVWEGQEARVALFDASFPNQVIVRLREQPAAPKVGKQKQPGSPLVPRGGAKAGVRT